jgi:hypothetical protein
VSIVLVSLSSRASLSLSSKELGETARASPLSLAKSLEKRQAGGKKCQLTRPSSNSVCSFYWYSLDLSSLSWIDDSPNARPSVSFFSFVCWLCHCRRVLTPTTELGGTFESCTNLRIKRPRRTPGYRTN